MTVHSTDIRALLLPPPMARGLALLVARSATLDAASAATVTAALFGDAPSFGAVQRVVADDLRAALGKAGGSASAAACREIAELLPRVGPETPVCDRCGELPLSDVGGKVSSLPAGAACPFCKDGLLALVPMKLRKVAWTDGRLTEPQTTHDLRVRPGDRIPLDDDGIMPWIGGWMHRGLEIALRDAGTPVYGFLAYMRLSRRAFDAPAEAATLLQQPDDFGLKDRQAMSEAAEAARDFLSAREPTNAPARRTFAFVRGADPDALPRVEIAGRTYVVEGRIGSGDKADVFRAAWDRPLTERAVIKVARDPGASALMDREARTLDAIASSKVNGTPFFAKLFPEVIAADRCVRDGVTRPATVYRYKNRYDWTVADAIREYPDGVEPQTMVWMWNRTLTNIAWLHMAGWCHGALVPEHMLIHPLNHGMTFIDWSYAVRIGRPLDPVEAAHAPFHPGEVVRKERTTAETDIAMSARCMIAVLGGDPADGTLPRAVPGPIADILRAHARYDEGAPRIADALRLEKEFGKVAEGVYGPRKYHPFQMPRRSR